MQDCSAFSPSGMRCCSISVSALQHNRTATSVHPAWASWWITWTPFVKCCSIYSSSSNDSMLTISYKPLLSDVGMRKNYMKGSFMCSDKCLLLCISLFFITYSRSPLSKILREPMAMYQQSNKLFSTVQVLHLGYSYFVFTRQSFGRMSLICRDFLMYLVQ